MPRVKYKHSGAKLLTDPQRMPASLAVVCLAVISSFYASNTLANKRIDTERFANCAQVFDQREQAQSQIPDEARLVAMEQLNNDLEELYAQLKVQNPDNVAFALRKCTETKREAMAEHIRRISGAERSKARYNKVLARLNLVIGNHPESLRYYRTAMELDPQDYDTAFKAFDAWALVAIRRIMGLGASLTAKDAQDLIRESDDFIQPIWNNDKAPLGLRVSVMSKRARLFQARHRYLEAVHDWRKILGIEPANEEALLQVADFEYTRGQRGTAQSLYTRLSQMRPDDEKVAARWVELLSESGSTAQLLNAASQAQKQFPDNTDISTHYALALLTSGRIDEADKVNQGLLAKNANHSEVRKTQSLIMEKRGDSAREANMPGSALGAYSKALEFDDKRMELRQKMARLLYDYRSELDFQPQKVSQQDMNEVLRLLDPLFEEPAIPQDLLLLYIRSASRSTSPAKGAQSCSRHMQDYGLPPTEDILLECLGQFRTAGNSSAAQDMARRAFDSPNFAHLTNEINRSLSGRAPAKRSPAAAAPASATQEQRGGGAQRAPVAQ